MAIFNDVQWNFEKFLVSADRRPVARFRPTAAHGVKPAIELIGADEVGDAYERVERSAVRYRFVIDVATIE